MEGRARTVLVAIVVLLVVGVPVAALFASGGGDDEPSAKPVAAGLRLERSTAFPELIVYVEPAANEPARAGGARSVTLRCVDADGQLVAAQDEAWPFSDTDSNTLDPHAHVTLDAERIGQIQSCRLVGTDPPVEGTLP
jgi:hypothetical protein